MGRSKLLSQLTLMVVFFVFYSDDGLCNGQVNKMIDFVVLIVSRTVCVVLAFREKRAIISLLSSSVDFFPYGIEKAGRKSREKSIRESIKHIARWLKRGKKLCFGKDAGLSFTFSMEMLPHTIYLSKNAHRRQSKRFITDQSDLEKTQPILMYVAFAKCANILDTGSNG